MNDAQLRYVFDRKKQANNDAKTGLLQIEVRKFRTNKRKLVSRPIRFSNVRQ